jgi:hypothetical protein
MRRTPNSVSSPLSRRDAAIGGDLQTPCRGSEAAGGMSLDAGVLGFDVHVAKARITKIVIQASQDCQLISKLVAP